MKNVILAILLVGSAQSALALSTLYSKVECSVEDQTCDKLISDMARQEAVTRVISGDQSELSVVLQQAVNDYRQKFNSDLDDESIVLILAGQQQ